MGGQINDFLLVLSLISVTTERLTEMVKNVWDAGKHLDEWQYKLYIHLWAAAIGTSLTVWTQSYAASLFPEMFRNWFGCVFIGVVTCSGAGVWNTSLSLLNNVNKELAGLKKKLLEAGGKSNPQ